MFTRVIRKIRGSFGYHRACKLYNAGKCDEALEVLSEVDISPQYDAKAVLFTAAILSRKGDIRGSILNYEHFLEGQVQYISKECDRTYLTLYARYFLQNAKRRLDRNFAITIPRQLVKESSQKASYLARGEFVI